MLASFDEYQPCPLARGLDVLVQVGQINSCPDVVGHLHRLILGHRGVAMEERARVAEGGVAQGAKAVEEPRLELGFGGVDVDGEVDVVGDEEGVLCAALEDVETFQDDDVGVVDELVFVAQDVVLQVGVQRHVQRGEA